METASPGDGPGGLTPKRVLSCEDCLSARRGASCGVIGPRFPADARCSPFGPPQGYRDMKEAMCSE